MRNSTNPPFMLIITVAIAFVYCSFVPAYPGASTGEDLPLALKAKDQRLDNSALSFRKVGTVTTKPGMGLGEDTRMGPPTAPQTQSIRYAMDSQLLSSGNRVLLIDRLCGDYYTPPGDRISGGTYVSAYSKSTNVGGTQRSLRDDNYPEEAARSASFYVDPIDSQSDIMKQAQMEIEFAHGVGFGKRILHVDSIAPDADGRFRVQGAMHLWGTDITRFDILVDDCLVVREGRIESRYGNASYTIEIHTEGAVSQDGMIFPKSGSLLWYLNAPAADGNKDAERRIWTQLSVEFRGVRLAVPEAEFVQLAEIEVPVGTHVVDTIAGLSYVKGGEGDPLGGEVSSNIAKELVQITKGTSATLIVSPNPPSAPTPPTYIPSGPSRKPPVAILKHHPYILIAGAICCATYAYSLVRRRRSAYRDASERLVGEVHNRKKEAN